MSVLDSSYADFEFQSDALPPGVHVESFSGMEEISRPFTYQVVLVSKLQELDLDKPVGKPAHLLLRGRTGTRKVHGVIDRFEQTTMGRGFARYEALLVPTLYPLHYTRNSRIFQKKSTVEIVTKVLHDAGFPAEVLQLALSDSYGPRDFCVQYQESDYDFIARLLEEEGIFYFFDHGNGKDVMVLGDSEHAFDPLPGASTIEFHDESPAAVFEQEVIRTFRGCSAIRPGKTVMRDFRFKQPKLDLETKNQAQDFDHLQVYYYPGEYVDPAMGGKLARVRMEELQWDRQRFSGIGTSKALIPGYRFKLLGHGRQSFNEEYTIVSVQQQGAQPQALAEMHPGGAQQDRAFQSGVLCIPAKVPFRPHRVTPRPTILGVQSAVVVGPSGEEIHCDEHGRVKVQFHWDREGKRNDDSSCWIRVSQPWGGTGFGGMMIPRVGQEVLVQFLEGDPDRPVIVGRVYNGENPVPHGLPATKMVSTIRSATYPGGGGFNEIKMDDSKGKEEMFIHSQFDRNEITGHDNTHKVANNQTEHVGVDRTESVGQNETLSVGTDRKRDVGKDETISIGNDRSMMVGSNKTCNVGKNETTNVGGNQLLSVGMAQSVSVALASIENVGLGKELSVGGAYAVTVGGINMETVGLLKKVTVGEKFELVCGKARIILEKSGNITIEGTHVQIIGEPIDLN